MQTTFTYVLDYASNTYQISTLLKLGLHEFAISLLQCFDKVFPFHVLELELPQVLISIWKQIHTASFRHTSLASTVVNKTCPTDQREFIFRYIFILLYLLPSTLVTLTGQQGNPFILWRRMSPTLNTSLFSLSSSWAFLAFLY